MRLIIFTTYFILLSKNSFSQSVFEVKRIKCYHATDELNLKKNQNRQIRQITSDSDSEKNKPKIPVGTDPPKRLVSVSSDGEELQVKILLSVPFLTMALGEDPGFKLFAKKDKGKDGRRQRLDDSEDTFLSGELIDTLRRSYYFEHTVYSW